MFSAITVDRMDTFDVIVRRGSPLKPEQATQSKNRCAYCHKNGHQGNRCYNLAKTSSGKTVTEVNSANMAMMTKEDAAELEELRASAAGRDANSQGIRGSQQSDITNLRTFDTGCYGTLVTLQDAGGEYTQACRRGASLGRVQPAFGPSRKIIAETNIGHITALTVPGLHSSFVPANDLIEEAWEAHMTKEGGTVTKPDFSTIPLYRKDGTWQIDISSIRNLDTPVIFELSAGNVQLQRPKSSIKPTPQQGLEGEERRKIFDIVEHIYSIQ